MQNALAQNYSLKPIGHIYFLVYLCISLNFNHICWFFISTSNALKFIKYSAFHFPGCHCPLVRIRRNKIVVFLYCFLIFSHFGNLFLLFLALQILLKQFNTIEFEFYFCRSGSGTSVESQFYYACLSIKLLKTE